MLKYLSQVDQSVHMIGIEGDGLPEGGDGRVELAERFQNSAQSIVQIWIIWLEGQGLAEVKVGPVPRRLLEVHPPRR